MTSSDSTAAGGQVTGEDEPFQRAFTTLWRRQCQQLGKTVSVVIRLDDQLYHCFGDVRRARNVVGERYHALKRVTHVPVRALMLRSAAIPAGDCPGVSDAVLDALDPADCALAKRLLSRTRDFWSATESVLAWDRVMTFADRIHPLIQRLIRVASSMEVRGLDAAMTDFENQTDLSSLHSGYFCVVSGKEPRYKELSKQYFTRYLQDKAAARGGVEHQLVYAEGDHSIDSVFELLAKRTVNRQLADVFTGSVTGLEQDILGDAARLAIEALFARRRTGKR